MLTLPWMGLFALAALWVNVLLIVTAAFKHVAALRRARMELDRGSLVRAKILDGRGDQGVFAQRVTEQVGRAVTAKGPSRILCVDARDVFQVFGGRVEIDGQARDIEASPGAAYWSEEGRGVRVETDFEGSWESASTSRGVRLTSREGLKPGDEAFLVLVGGAATLVATMNPRGEIGRGILRLGSLVVVSLLGAALVTALLFVPPVFGAVSTFGGVLALAFFLAIQPIAVEMHDRARLPNERRVGGTWTRP